MKLFLALLLGIVFTAAAADINGTWKATAEGPNGAIERTFVFKVDGEKLTGKTTSTMLGESVINEGKISGDDLSFSITANFGGNETKINYKGKVKGNEIRLESNFGDQTIVWNAKKAS